MSSKTITMSCRDDDGGISIVQQTFDNDCSWPAIAYQFYTLLASMGYKLNYDDVGGDVESFVLATQKD